MPLTTHRAPSESAHAFSKPSRMTADDQSSPVVSENSASALSTTRAFLLTEATYAALRSARPGSGIELGCGGLGGGEGGDDGHGVGMV